MTEWNKLPNWECFHGSDPIVTTALHAGHFIPSSFEPWMAITGPERWVIEEPFVGEWTTIVSNRVHVRRSRFAGDLERPREQALLLNQDESIGFRVWNRTLPEFVKKDVLSFHDRFYREMEKYLQNMHNRWRRFAIINFHNMSSEGDEWVRVRSSEGERLPDILIDVGPLPERMIWSPLISQFIDDLRSCNLCGLSVCAREVADSQAGAFTQWVYQRFPTGSVCVITVRVGRIFQSHATETINYRLIDEIQHCLASTLPGMMKHLTDLNG